MSEIITPELLRSWDPCVDGYHRFCELFPDGADLGHMQTLTGRDMKLLRYDHTTNTCLVCTRTGNVYRLVEIPAGELMIGGLV